MFQVGHRMILESALVRLERLFSFRKSKCLEFPSTVIGEIDYDLWQALRLNCVASELRMENCKRYTKYVKFLLHLIEDYQNSADLFSFSWSLPSPTGTFQAVTKNGFLFELENVMLNYCSFLVLLGFNRECQAIEGLKQRCKLFQAALGVVKFMLGRAKFFTSEFAVLSDAISYLVQICYLEVSITNCKQNNLSSLKIINSALHYYSKMEQPDVAVGKFWAAYRNLLAAKLFFNSNRVGRAIGALQKSLDVLTSLLREGKEGYFGELLHSIQPEVEQLLAKYAKENSMIYNQRISTEEVQFEKEFGFADFVQEIPFEGERERGKDEKPPVNFPTSAHSVQNELIGKAESKNEPRCFDTSVDESGISTITTNSISKWQLSCIQNKLSLFN